MKWSGRFQGYHGAAFRKDAISGLIVGIIAIPLGMGFAIASGVKPEYGLYTTIIAGILISLFGGSRFQIGGPTGAFIPVLLGIILQYGYENLLIAGFMAGCMLVVIGLLRLGSLIRYIPRPVTIGFTAGIAILIFSGQIANFLGLSGIEKHERFLPNMAEIGRHVGTLNLYSLVTGGVCLAVLLILPRIWPRIPSSLAGLAVSTVVAALFFNGEVATIGSSFGEISGSLPQFRIPEVTAERLLSLLQPAFIIAMLGGIESLLSAVVADGMAGGRHNSNRELVGQGIANMVTPFFGGIPATGAIARTATNIKNGAVSPMSGIIHGIVVLLVVVLFAPLASHIPLSGMAPILMLVAWNMSERKEVARMLKARSSDTLVLLVTLLLTVFTELTTAVAAGLLIALVLHVRRSGRSLLIHKVLPDQDSRLKQVLSGMVGGVRDCPQIGIFTIDGPLFFGASGSFEEAVSTKMEPMPKILLLRMGKVPFIDLTGEADLERLSKRLAANGGMLLLSGVREQPLKLLRSTGLLEHIGEDHLFLHTGEAIDFALQQLDRDACGGCSQYAFRECSALCKARVSQPQSPVAGDGKNALPAALSGQGVSY
ncbi:SulP family inorganic anion transporter [Paenibacillus sp. CAU 1782]